MAFDKVKNYRAASAEFSESLAICKLLFQSGRRLPVSDKKMTAVQRHRHRGDDQT
jgi:hypothetical protein